MYVCLCYSVSDRDIRAAAAEGVTTLAELSRRTGCSTNCGSCADFAEQTLQTALRSQERSRPLFALQVLSNV
jgi:bacterioferritin-associated ferredoxin